MRVIFSRKGFDSAAGGGASPVIDGVPMTLPIPAGERSVVRYGDLGGALPDLVTELSRGRWDRDALCHLDPDLHKDTLRSGRLADWRGSLGQEGAAQGHLANQGVTDGDLFLFFGLFRTAERDASGRWRFCGRSRHALFGWLQIDVVIPLGPDGRWFVADHPWLAEHPHARAGWGANNTLYLARPTLDLLGLEVDRPGYGWFGRAIDLSCPDAQRVSDWRVPRWLDPTQGGVGMTYHPTPRWLGDGRVRAAARGQEFVANIGQRRDALAWVVELFSEKWGGKQ